MCHGWEFNGVVAVGLLLLLKMRNYNVNFVVKKSKYENIFYYKRHYITE